MIAARFPDYQPPLVCFPPVVRSFVVLRASSAEATAFRTESKCFKKNPVTRPTDDMMLMMANTWPAGVAGLDSVQQIWYVERRGPRHLPYPARRWIRSLRIEAGDGRCTGAVYMRTA